MKVLKQVLYWPTKWCNCTNCLLNNWASRPTMTLEWEQWSQCWWWQDSWGETIPTCQRTLCWLEPWEIATFQSFYLKTCPCSWESFRICSLEYWFLRMSILILRKLFVTSSLSTLSKWSLTSSTKYLSCMKQWMLDMEWCWWVLLAQARPNVMKHSAELSCSCTKKANNTVSTNQLSNIN